MNHYKELLTHWRTTEALDQLAELAAWDQETKMPSHAAGQRAEQLAAVTRAVHERLASAEFAELLERARCSPGDSLAEANIRLMEDRRKEATAVPAELAAAIAKSTSLAKPAWSEARASESVQVFLPCLEEIVALKREEASALADGGTVYDALLQRYEPHVTSVWVTEVFTRLRRELVSLRDRILGSSRAAAEPGLSLGRDRQLLLARELAGVFGYDWRRGRMDISQHPFTSGKGRDVRITTRVNEASVFECLFSVIHEAGHAVYEQGIPDDYAMMPVGKGASFGVHESQARFFENQIGRSEAFSRWLFTRLQRDVSDFGVADGGEFFALSNRVSEGRIRTESDEVQYNLHIMLRFDLERRLISGELEVSELADAWNAGFAADFGYPVDRPSDGLLQDIHWAAGYFGYFPTYALGNIYSGCLHKALREDLPDLDSALEAGDPMPAVEWMREKVHRFGAAREPLQIISSTSREGVSERPLTDYLKHKFSGIYGL